MLGTLITEAQILGELLRVLSPLLVPLVPFEARDLGWKMLWHFLSRHY